MTTTQLPEVQVGEGLGASVATPPPATTTTRPGDSPGAGPVGPDPEAAAADAGPKPSVRTAIAVSFPVLTAAIMVGGVFTGISPRPYAAAAGLLGVTLAYGVARLGRRPLLSYAAIVVGLFGIGLVTLFPNFGDMLQVTKRIHEATSASSLLTPPVPFATGWMVIVGWLMALVGFATAWVAIVVGWRSWSLFLPLPIAAIAAISVPDNAQVPSGIVALVLFAIGLGLISSEQAAGDDPESMPSVAYEVRKALKALPIIAAITGVLFVAAQSNFLFPDPLYDPAQQPQKPETQPLSEAEDRVLFEVKSELTGPFRMGSLDEYDGTDWRLPPFAASRLVDVPKDGIVDKEFRGRQDLSATFTVRGLGGAVLPDLPNTVGVAASGPRIAYDSRNSNLRLVNGQPEAGFTYTVTAAGLPKVADLQAINLTALPKDIKHFTQIPAAPPAVQGLLDQAPAGSAWDKFDFARTWILDNVTAEGTGTPKSVTPERVVDMISGSKHGSPFEIVAAQAMLARWLGVPSRIGYGFDGGEKVGDVLQVRPAHGAAFVEVWFPEYKWLPVIGTPRKADPTVGSDPSTQKVDPLVQPSNDVAARIYLPREVLPKSVVAKQIAVTILAAIPVILLLLAAYIVFPALRKLRLRSVRRAIARQGGARARVALAYSEWRDYATDLGFLYPTDTPLMFLDRFVDDDEHEELAWLTTRVLWGDLQYDDDPDLATTAEELARSLRRRLASLQPASLRAVAIVSRFSLRHHYGADALPTRSRKWLPRPRKEQPSAPLPA